jgi:trans-aconitate methyltransferase
VTREAAKAACNRIDIWHTHDNHIIENHTGVVAWSMACEQRPIPRAAIRRCVRAFLSKYTDEIGLAYPVRADVRVMVKFLCAG